jgi:hypothetical protein
MKLFLAKIIYKIVKPFEEGFEQFDEQLCFVNARDLHEAFFKARMLGVKNEDEVKHESGSSILWKFIDVPFLKEITSFEDGLELHSAVLEKEASEFYEKFIKARASELQSSIELGLQPLLSS